MATRSAFRFVSRAVAGVLLLALLLSGAGLYWLSTQHALEWLARQAVAASDGRLILEGMQGSLFDRISVSRAAFKDAGLEVEARNVVLDWQPQALLRREARVTQLSVDDLRIATADTGSAKPPQLPAALRLPLNATVEDARIKRIEIVPGQVVQDLHLRLRARAETHELDIMNIATKGWRAAGTIRLGAAAPFAAAGIFDLEGKVRGEPIKAHITLGGSLEALEVQATAAARGASAKAAALLRPFSFLPLDKLRLDADNLDLATWDKTLPQTKIGISLEATMPAPERFAGTVRVENESPGPVDARRVPLARAALSFTGNGTRWMLSDIDLLIGKSGRVRGSGTIEGDNARLELALADIITTDVYRQLQALTVSGQVALTGDPDAQRLTAKVEGAGAQLELAASHVQQIISVERGTLRAEDARLDFTGRVALTANRAFSANAEFSGFDPSRFIDAPSANLNGKASAQGELAPAWLANVLVTVTESRFRGHPLAANAKFTSSAKQLFSGEAHAVYAGNRLDVSGRFGEPTDKLKWSLDANNLKAIDSTLAGKVKAQGTLAGSTDQPSTDFKLTARGLAAGEVGARTIEAQGMINAGADGALRLTARIVGIKARDLIIDELKFDAKGTRLQHEITAALRGADISASLRGDGGLDDQWRWNGNLTALEARGRFPFRLTAPARVNAGRSLLVIENLQAAALGGAVGPVSVRVAEGRITSKGVLTGLTAKALLSLAPQAGIDPRDLAIGGRWDFALEETVSGFAEIHRETGDLGLKAESNQTLGLNEFKMNVTAQSNALEAKIDAQSARMGTLSAELRTRIGRRNDAWVLAKDAPLEGLVTLDMQSLAWVLALAPQLDRVDGRLAAQLTIAGTAGQPLITGIASADDVQVRAVGPGLNLTDGTLRASLDGRTLKLSKFYLKAGDGKIEADGSADLSDGLRSLDITARADRARILASPNLTVVLSGIGHAGLRDFQLALDGKFQIDEGSYDLGTERKPELSDDVVIAGQMSADAPGAKPLRVVLDLAVDLKDNFVVRGYGLDAVLGGSMRIASRDDALRAIGTIHTVRGDYFAYGQKLEIENCELNFSGPLGNPGINLRAIRKIKSVQVGVEVSGSLQRPAVKLVSDPAMSDSERLGWLVLGHDPQTASAAELAILQAAALTAGASRTSPAQKQLAENSGLDEFGISQGGDDALGAVALGKRITDKLTVRLEQSLGGTAGSVMKIDYLLSERWRLEGSAGADNAIDILFTLRFD
jgi:translocation and assembly module TamB